MLDAASLPGMPKPDQERRRAHRCDVWADSKEGSSTHKVSSPKHKEFNYEVGIDVFEVRDMTGVRYDILIAVDMGTVFDQGWIVRNGETVGPPSA